MSQQEENQKNSSKSFSIDSLLEKNEERSEGPEVNFNSTFHSQVKSHRRRSTFSALQVHVLETEFYKHRYVSPEKRAGLATFLGLSQQQIKIWFQNRRYKTKVKNEGGKKFHSTTLRNNNNGNQQIHPIINVPLQPTNPIYPVWLLQRRATLLNELARQVRQPTLFSLQSTITQRSSDQKNQ